MLLWDPSIESLQTLRSWANYRRLRCSDEITKECLVKIVVQDLVVHGDSPRFASFVAFDVRNVTEIFLLSWLSFNHVGVDNQGKAGYEEAIRELAESVQSAWERVTKKRRVSRALLLKQSVEKRTSNTKDLLVAAVQRRRVAGAARTSLMNAMDLFGEEILERMSYAEFKQYKQLVQHPLPEEVKDKTKGGVVTGKKNRLNMQNKQTGKAGKEQEKEKEKKVKNDKQSLSSVMPEFLRPDMNMAAIAATFLGSALMTSNVIRLDKGAAVVGHENRTELFNSNFLSAVSKKTSTAAPHYLHSRAVDVLINRVLDKDSGIEIFEAVKPYLKSNKKLVRSLRRVVTLVLRLGNLSPGDNVRDDTINLIKQTVAESVLSESLNHALPTESGTPLHEIKLFAENVVLPSIVQSGVPATKNKNNKPLL
jgi:hypothetical protein